MTGEEAKKEIIDMANTLQLIPNTPKGKAVSMALKALEQTSWIPVSERLPEDHKNVLIYLSSNQITIGLYNSHRLPFMDKPIGWGADTPHGWKSSDVVAWMPLPEPYKPQESEVLNGRENKKA